MNRIPAGRRVRRVGLVYLGLLTAGAIGALLVARRLDDPASVLAALLPTAAGAYLAWAAFRADRTEAAGTDGPGALADRLSTAVRLQWEAEARVRRLDDPYALPVAWGAADARLVEDWDAVCAMAGAEPGAGAGQLAGRDGEIGAVFAERVPTRRLLVLGDPGSGKTVLLVRLLLSVIGRRRQGEPVPVLFPLASWDPARQDLHGWMEQRLVQDHAELGAPAPGEYGGTCAAMLLHERLILPLLDGFDELPVAVGARALHAVNETLPYGCGLVLSSRPGEYRAALHPWTGVPARLAGMAGIQLEPLAGADVARFLLRDAGGPGIPAAARWAPVVRELGTDTPVARALRSPLMVSLARTVYNPRPGDGAQELPDPADLVDRSVCPTRAAVENHLFEAFVGAAYRPRAGRPCRWTAARARTALRYLAIHMERGFDGAAEVAWWKLHHAVPAAVPRVLAGMFLGAFGWLLEGLTMELVYGLAHDELFTPHWEARGGLGVMAAGICGGLVCGFGAGVMVTVLCAAAAAPGVWDALVLGRLADGGAMTLIGVIVSGFAFGGRPRLRPPSDWDRRVILTTVTVAGLYVAAFHSGVGAVAALIYGVVVCAIGATVGPTDPASRTSRTSRNVPAARVRWHWSLKGSAMGLLGGLLLGSVLLTEGLLAWAVWEGPYREHIAPADPLEAVWAAEQVTGVFAMACLLVHGLRAVPVDLGTSVDARALLRNDRRTLGACVLTAALLGAAVIGTQDWFAMVWGSTRIWGGEVTDDYLWLCLVGLVPALLTALAIGLRQAAWGRYTVARCYLALRAGLPWDLMAFLADAHEHRGVLRRVGADYQFRHIELQHHLAGGEGPFTGSSAATVPRSRCAPSPTSGPPQRRGRAGP